MAPDVCRLEAAVVQKNKVLKGRAQGRAASRMTAVAQVMDNLRRKGPIENSCKFHPNDNAGVK